MAADFVDGYTDPERLAVIRDAFIDGYVFAHMSLAGGVDGTALEAARDQARRRYKLFRRAPRVVTDPFDATLAYRVVDAGLEMREGDAAWEPAFRFRLKETTLAKLTNGAAKEAQQRVDLWQRLEGSPWIIGDPIE